MPRKKKICIDFDGVIAAPDPVRGAQFVGEVIPGAREALRELSDEYDIIILSARADKPSGVQWIKNYLRMNAIPFGDVTNVKPTAVAYIDDRGIRYDGDWEETMNLLRRIL